MFVEARRVRFRAQLDADAVVRFRLAPRVAPFQIEHDRVTVVDAAAFDRLVPRRAIAQPLQSQLDGLVGDCLRRPPKRDGRELAGIEDRDRVERRGEGQRLPLFNRNVPHVGRVDRLHAALAQRIVDGAGNQIVRDVMQDLILVALLDDAGRRFARPEARHAHLAGVIGGDAINLRVDHVARNLDAHILARLVDVSELGFHRRLVSEGVRKGGLEPP